MNSSDSKKLRAFLASLPLHGGDLHAASLYFGIALENWVDLSTGINAEPYPLPTIPAQVFNTLPYERSEFIEAAKQYYRVQHILPLAGSQAAIQLLPRVLNAEASLPILLPEVGYREHYEHWDASGAIIDYYYSSDMDNMNNDISAKLAGNSRQHLLIIRPNNPTTLLISRENLLVWSSMLDESAYLIVDEAFIDTVPQESMLRGDKLPENVIVLRSFGKFFGLAGIRLGFVFAKPTLLKEIAAIRGVWQINGPAQYIATQALSNSAWQKYAIDTAFSNAQGTEAIFNRLIQHFNLSAPMRDALFLSYSMPLYAAASLYRGLASAGILTRLHILPKDQGLLRVGCLSRGDNIALAKVNAAIDTLCGYKSVSQLFAEL